MGNNNNLNLIWQAKKWEGFAAFVSTISLQSVHNALAVFVLV